MNEGVPSPEVIYPGRARCPRPCPAVHLRIRRDSSFPLRQQLPGKVGNQLARLGRVIHAAHMVVLAENVVAFNETIVQRPGGDQAGRKEVGRGARKKRKQVLSCSRRGCHHAGRGVEPRQLCTERTNLCGAQRLARIHHADAVARTRDRSWDRVHGQVTQRGTQALIAQEPEEFVFDNASPRRRAELFQGRGSYGVYSRRRKVIGCIRGLGITAECISGAVETISARLHANVDD